MFVTRDFVIMNEAVLGYVFSNFFFQPFNVLIE